jgi:hypothetical protein
MKQVTLVITSCGRFNLLRRTIDSFFKFNTYPIEECIIVEDSGIIDHTEFMDIIFTIPVPCKFIINGNNLGQIKSIDLAYSKVTTDYIFHCEDDWEFYKSRFIEDSFDILLHDDSVINVWLRSYDDTNHHPIEHIRHDYNTGHYYYMSLDYKKFWHGFSFNPGLRRTSDVMKLYPFSELTPVIEKNGKLIIGEIDLSVYYFNLGYRGAITSNYNGYVRHIGWDEHITLPWEK